MDTLTQLLGSETRVDILSLMILHPEKSFYVREIERKTGQDIKAVRNELEKLKKIGLVSSREDGNRKYFSLNKKSSIYPEIKNLVLKTAALGDVLRSQVSELKSVEFAFIYGSFAKGEEREQSDIDLFLIGDVDGRALQEILSKAKASLRREINSSVFTLTELRKRLQKKEPFLKEVLASKKIFLVGEESELRKALRRR